MPPRARAAITRKRPSTNAPLEPIRNPPFPNSRPPSDLECGDALLPLPAIEALHVERRHVDTLDAADVHVDPVGMRARDVETRDPAVPTEVMLRGHRPEAIGREIVRAGEESKALTRDDVMEIALAAADRTVAFGHPAPLEVRGHLEANAPAVTAPGMGPHGAGC